MVIGMKGKGNNRMTKNELIKELESVEGNPVILLSDVELGYVALKSVYLEKMHQSNEDLENYITDLEFKSEIGLNTFYHDNYNEKVEECIVFGI